MSEPHWNIGFRHSTINLRYDAPLPQVDNLGWTPRSACEWSPDLQNEMMAFFVKCDYPFRLISEIPFGDPLRSEIRRFFISLDAYIDSPNPVIPYKDIL